MSEFGYCKVNHSRRFLTNVVQDLHLANSEMTGWKACPTNVFLALMIE